MGLAMCTASRHSCSSPHHLLTLTWPCSLVEACWAQQNWCGWPQKVIPSCPFPQKVRSGAEINPPKCILSHGSAHICCAVLCLRVGQQYGEIWELWDLCPPQKAVDCTLPSKEGTARSVSYHSALGFSTFSPCPVKECHSQSSTESQHTLVKNPILLCSWNTIKLLLVTAGTEITSN